MRGDDAAERARAAVRSLSSHALSINRRRAAEVGDALLLAEVGALDTDRREYAVELAHQLVGSAGTFGFPAASDLAADLERFFAAGLFDVPRVRAARTTLARLHQVLEADPALPPEDDDPRDPAPA